MSPLERFLNLGAHEKLVLFRSPSDFKWIDKENQIEDGDGKSRYVYGILRDKCCGSRLEQRAKLGRIVVTAWCVYLFLFYSLTAIFGSFA
jgi:hypothetical protein